jgi:hypothetical protein
MARWHGPARLVDPPAQFFAGLEERHRLLVHRHGLAGARIASEAGLAPFHPEGAEATQLDTAVARQSGSDLVEYRRHDQFDVRPP